MQQYIAAWNCLIVLIDGIDCIAAEWSDYSFQKHPFLLLTFLPLFTLYVASVWIFEFLLLLWENVKHLNVVTCSVVTSLQSFHLLYFLLTFSDICTLALRTFFPKKLKKKHSFLYTYNELNNLWLLHNCALDSFCNIILCYHHILIFLY